MPNPYAPDEPPAALWFEQVNLAAIFVGGIAYGVHISVYFMCTYYLLKSRSKHYEKWLIFIFVLFGLGTTNICINMHFGQMTWIDNRNYPGGPFAYLIQQSGNTILTAGNAESILIPLLADGLLIWRCYVLYRLWWLLIIPIFAWLASFACGILLTIQASHPHSSLFTNNTLDFSIPYFALSMSLNMLLTMLLIWRLLYMKYQLVKVFGADYAQLYSTIATMLFESALPYGLISFIFIVLYGTRNTAAGLFIPLLVQVECISPMVIILRVARGQAWDSNTISAGRLSSMKHTGLQKPIASSGGHRGRYDTQEVSMIEFTPGQSMESSQRTVVHRKTLAGVQEV